MLNAPLEVPSAGFRTELLCLLRSNPTSAVAEIQIFYPVYGQRTLFNSLDGDGTSILS